MRRATRDTYALERVGPDTEVRRLVKAGALVPDHYEVEDGDGALEGSDLESYVPEAGYSHQKGFPGPAGAKVAEADAKAKSAPVVDPKPAAASKTSAGS